MRRRVVVLCCLTATAACGGAEPESSPTTPSSDYCSSVATWAADWTELEDQVVALANSERAAGANCGSAGAFAAAGPLATDSRLRCAARVHARDMAVRGFFDHVNPEGLDPFDRIDRCGFPWVAAGENIAAGQTSAEEVVAGWMASAGHCANIMRPEFTHLGVGYYFRADDVYHAYWTQVFATPPP